MFMEYLTQHTPHAAQYRLWKLHVELPDVWM